MDPFGRELKTELSNKEQAYIFGRNVFMGLMLEVARVWGRTEIKETRLNSSLIFFNADGYSF